MTLSESLKELVTAKEKLIDSINELRAMDGRAPLEGGTQPTYLGLSLNYWKNRPVRTKPGIVDDVEEDNEDF